MRPKEGRQEKKGRVAWSAAVLLEARNMGSFLNSVLLSALLLGVACECAGFGNAGWALGGGEDGLGWIMRIFLLFRRREG